MATDVVPVIVGDDKKDVVGETEADITQEEEVDQLDEDYEEDDGVEEGQLEDNTLDGDENEEDLDGDENEEDFGDEDEEDLGGDDQPSIETNINKDSTENPNIATDSAGGDAPSDVKGSVKEQMDSATDAYKDEKQRMDASQNTVLDAYKDVKQVCQLFAPSNNNNNTPAAANQQQQPQPQRRRPQQNPQGRRQTQQEVSDPTPQEQQPTESDSTPQPPTQPRQRQKPQGQRQTQQEVSVPTQQEQQPTESDSTPQPPPQPRQRPQKQRQPQKKVSVTPQAQQPQQQPQQMVSVSPPQAQAQQAQQQPQQKVSVSPPRAQPQQPQQKVSVSPPQAQAQQQVNKVSDAPPNTEPQPQQQLETQANPSVREKGTIPSGVVTPEEDATTLYTAFKGRGCDVGRLLHVLTKRDATHRLLIQQHYKKNYGEDLIDRISSELSSLGDLKEKVGLDLTVNPTGTLSRTFSSNIKRAVSLWMFEESERDATIVWQALQVTSFDKAAVTEVICSRTPSQLCNIQRAYRTKFSSQLLQEINSSNVRFFGSHKELLIACLDNQARDEGTNVDLKMAEEDAKQLYQDGEKIWGTNDRTFINIFAKRNRPHLVAIDAAYHKLYGHSLEKAVEKETTRSFKVGLLTLLSCAKNPAKYFAEVLYNAMKGAGTSDTTLIRTVVTRAGIDMEDVKKEYAQAYKISLKDAIHRDTSGDYRTFLISLLE